MELSLTTILKNEENGIEKMLESVFCKNSPVSQAIIGIDNKSTDKTEELVVSFCEKNNIKSKIIKFDFDGNFGKARNEVIKHVETSHVIVVDGDEYVEDGSFDRLNQLLKQNPIGLDFITSTMIGHDIASGSQVSSPTMRIFGKDYKYKFRVHEHPDVPMDSNGLHLNNFIVNNIKLPSEDRDNSNRIKMLLLDIKETNDVMQMFNLASEYMASGEFENAKHYYELFLDNGGNNNVNYMARLKIARCLHFMKLYDDEYKYLRLMMDDFPTRNEHLVQLGINEMQHKEWFHAINYLTVACNISKPNTPEMGFDHYYTWVPWLLLNKIYSHIHFPQGEVETYKIISEHYPEALERIKWKS